MFRNLFCRSVLLSIVLQAPLCAHATTWQALSGNYGGDPLVFGGSYFEDNIYNGSIYEKVLTAPSGAFPGISPATPYSFSFVMSSYSGRYAPQVDVENGLADFSSLTLTLWESDVPCGYRDPQCNVAITSVPLGNLGWIPIAINGDGTYTATWSTEVIYPGNVQPMSITFAHAVPIPGSIFLLGSGLIPLILSKKRNLKSPV